MSSEPESEPWTMRSMPESSTKQAGIIVQRLSKSEEDLEQLKILVAHQSNQLVKLQLQLDDTNPEATVGIIAQRLNKSEEDLEQMKALLRTCQDLTSRVQAVEQDAKNIRLEQLGCSFEDCKGQLPSNSGLVVEERPSTMPMTVKAGTAQIKAVIPPRGDAEIAEPPGVESEVTDVDLPSVEPIEQAVGSFGHSRPSLRRSHSSLHPFHEAHRSASHLNLDNEHEDGEEVVSQDSFQSHGDAVKSSLSMSSIKSFTEAANPRQIEHSMWDAPLLLHLGHSSSHTNDVFLTVAFFMNIFIQSMFCVLIYISFPTSTSYDRSVTRTWRYILGHSLQEVDSEGRSLVSRVCAEDPTLSMARHELDLLTSATIYHEHLLLGSNNGTTLVLLTLTIWCLQWAQDVFKNVTLQLACVKLPRSGKTVLQHQAGECRFVTIAYTRLAWISTVNIVRFFLGIWLLVLGTQWLIYTPDLTDIVLNGVALSFIRDIDECLYEAFSTVNFGDFLESVEPLKVDFSPKRPVLNVVLLAGYLAYVMTEIIPNNQHMEGYLSDLCGGNKDFVITKHPSLDMYFSASTTPSAEGGPEISGEKHAAVTEMISFSQSSRGRPANPTKSDLVLSGVSRLKILASESASGVADMVMTQGCRDETRSSFPVYWDVMQEKVSLHSNRPADEFLSCEDVKDFCGRAPHTLVRLLCPITCGCYSTHSWAATNKGCAFSTCQESGGHPRLAYYDQDVECVDTAAANLTGSTPVGGNWRKFWNSYVLSLTESEELLNDLTDTQRSQFSKENVQKHRKKAMSTGCDVITAFNLEAALCADSKSFQSVASYCPITCGCTDADYWGCPPSCRADR